ncbi:F-box/LRR-repeat protein 8 [Frankliniella fusca]|uniref:F-box/LRR-repeat protein 8 n=1 Tax=Frankliniella fusca TaxID=407009 RepID=A0AAE1HRI5_9NEOP|nr:F-box/LRR-repeat protein 8 [Frankliniella fusca]
MVVSTKCRSNITQNTRFRNKSRILSSVGACSLLWPGQSSAFDLEAEGFPPLFLSFSFLDWVNNWGLDFKKENLSFPPHFIDRGLGALGLGIGILFVFSEATSTPNKLCSVLAVIAHLQHPLPRRLRPAPAVVLLALDGGGVLVADPLLLQVGELLLLPQRRRVRHEHLHLGRRVRLRSGRPGSLSHSRGTAHKSDKDDGTRRQRRTRGVTLERSALSCWMSWRAVLAAASSRMASASASSAMARSRCRICSSNSRCSSSRFSRRRSRSGIRHSADRSPLPIAYPGAAPARSAGAHGLSLLLLALAVPVLPTLEPLLVQLLPQRAQPAHGLGLLLLALAVPVLPTLEPLLVQLLPQRAQPAHGLGLLLLALAVPVLPTLEPLLVQLLPQRAQPAHGLGLLLLALAVPVLPTLEPLLVQLLPQRAQPAHGLGLLLLALAVLALLLGLDVQRLLQAPLLARRLLLLVLVAHLAQVDLLAGQGEGGALRQPQGLDALAVLLLAGLLHHL